MTMPVAQKHTLEEDGVFPSVRIPKSMKRQLQQNALDKESTVQPLVRSTIHSELSPRSPGTARARNR